MRLLLRANSHRDVGDGALEIAASPDTPRREHWQWDLRLLTDRAPEYPPGPERRIHADLPRGDGSLSRVEVSTDPALVQPSIEVLQVRGRNGINRSPNEVLALILGRGHTLVEGRHRLDELDVMILEGDDPYALSLATNDGATATVAVVRLRGIGAIGWVP
jgi:hypothetical protein